MEQTEFIQFEQFETKMFKELTQKAIDSSKINPELYSKYQVMRGLRDLEGKGVLVGLTEIGEVHSYIIDEGEKIPVPGRLTYRGIDINDIVDGFIKDERYGFEETSYLLLFGHLPNAKELKDFEQMLSAYQKLPEDFVRGTILKSPGKDIMNMLARSILSLYSYDDNPDDNSIENVLKQCMKLIAWMPLLAVYGYHSCAHYHGNKSLFLHSPLPHLSTAENILHMLRPDSKYTKLEAALLDISLVLHAEHGGGNNSTFVTHVITSTGSDTYSVMAAAIGALKGPKHGGANIKTYNMLEDIKQNVTDWQDEDEIKAYLMKIMNKQAFDRSGLIYGIGHAVYSISDPREVLLKEYAGKLAQEKGLAEEYDLFSRVEKLAPDIVLGHNKSGKVISANVDFYSGFVYKMLGLPLELFTPIFAISRMSGWSAHRIEEIVNNGKIVRPAYKSVAPRREYIPLSGRN
ncbi:citrate/2-methylcitrate synthase [Dehalobacter restrictus]|uniref:Citrate synthase n=1 Tax=Dehalobacter restrictus TaxID=55583 RepID=A0A857DME7_9FIRM|nr:citrate/2-methylcitrate synthase [Dehalobacter restrictus]QHA01569.1 citrate synthase [Dehalobacter restrictus]